MFDLTTQDLDQVCKQPEENMNTIIKWTIYDGTEKTRPHSFRCKMFTWNTREQEVAFDQLFIIKPCSEEEVPNQAFCLGTSGDYEYSGEWIFKNWVWDGDIKCDGGYGQFPLQVGDAWAPCPVFPSENGD